VAPAENDLAEPVEIAGVRLGEAAPDGAGEAPRYDQVAEHGLGELRAAVDGPADAEPRVRAEEG